MPFNSVSEEVTQWDVGSINLLSTFVYTVQVVFISDKARFWLDEFARYLAMSAATLEPLLVLGFSLERLFAIRRPLQVRSHFTHRYEGNSIPGRRFF